MALSLHDPSVETVLKRISYQQGRAEHAMRFFHALDDVRGGPTGRRPVEVTSVQRRPSMAIGILGIAAVTLYVGATLMGSVLDAHYSQIGNAISELTGPDAPNRPLMAPIYITYNVLQLGVAYALLKASSGGGPFRSAVVLFAIAAVSGIPDPCPDTGSSASAAVTI